MVNDKQKSAQLATFVETADKHRRNRFISSCGYKAYLSHALRDVLGLELRKTRRLNYLLDDRPI
jgi:hypothetical protein